MRVQRGRKWPNWLKRMIVQQLIGYVRCEAMRTPRMRIACSFQTSKDVEGALAAHYSQPDRSVRTAATSLLSTVR